MQQNHIFYPSEPQPQTAAALNTITLPELYDNVYRPSLTLIEDFLYSGVYLFVGPPKIGKSFFMAQLAYHVATGTKLWNYPVQQSDVLYLSLEDDMPRLQKRFSRMFGVDTTANLYLCTNSNSLSDGLELQLSTFLQMHPDTKLVIIDTLQKVRELSGNNYSYSQDYAIISKLKTIAAEHNICIIVVHHTRKLEAEDKFDMISGTNGLLGAADGAMVLHKNKRTDLHASLSIVGREQQDQTLALEFLPQTCTWKFVQAQKDLWQEPADPLLEKIAAFLSNEKPTWYGTATQLLTALAIKDMKPNAFTRRLNVKVDKLYNDYGILYTNQNKHTSRLITLHKMEKKEA